MARRRGATAAQVALAWVHGRGAALGLSVVPIPGTKKVTYLEENVGALSVALDDDDRAQLDALAAEVTGARY